MLDCYEEALRASPRLGGKVILAFTVTTAGRTSHVKIAASTTGSKYLDRCVVQALKKTVFPRRKKPVTVRVPVVFTPAKASKKG